MLFCTQFCQNNPFVRICDICRRLSEFEGFEKIKRLKLFNFSSIIYVILILYDKIYDAAKLSLFSKINFTAELNWGCTNETFAC